MQIAVGGCLAQQDRNGIVDRAPYVDVVFGTHNIDVLPVLLERARHNGEAQVEIEEALKTFLHAAHPPRQRLRRVGVHFGGCNNTHVLHRALVARQGTRPPPG